MKGHENLKPFNTISKEEAHAIRSKGGKARAEKKRRRKAIKEILTTMMSLKISDIQDEGVRETFMKAAGSLAGEETIAEAVAGGMLVQSIRGDSRMVTVLLKLIGEDPDLKIKKKEHELKVKQAQKEEAETVYQDDGLEEALKDSVKTVWKDEEE